MQINLPFKTYYSLNQAADLLTKLTDRPDIDIEYLLLLGLRGKIRVAVDVHPGKLEAYSEGIIIMDPGNYQEDDQQKVECIDLLKIASHTLSEDGAMLILSEFDLKTILFENEILLAEARFNNIYSLINDEFIIDDEKFSIFSNFLFSDKLSFYEVYDPVKYSISSKKFVCMELNEEKTAYIPTHETADSNEEWSLGYWWKQELTIDLYDSELIFSNRKFTKNDLYIFGVDLEALMNNSMRKKMEVRSSNLNSIKKHKLKERHNDVLNTKKENSARKIIHCLAAKAGLDVTNPDTAFVKLQQYSDSHKLELPSRNTCKSWFKRSDFS